MKQTAWRPAAWRGLLTGVLLAVAGCGESARTNTSPVTAARPALTVSLTTPVQQVWPRTLAADGDIAAWQEVAISAEIGDERLLEVHVNVGDRVKRGQVLARIASDTVQAGLAQTHASVAEAEAALAEAVANAERARNLQVSGFYSAQMGNQYQTAAQTARARLESARARVRTDEIRLEKTRVLAPDDGVISARTATVGALAQPGQELFRLIRGGRLEWRARVIEADLERVKPGQASVLRLPGGDVVRGRVRAIAPSIDPKTRDGLVYVDLPPVPNLAARAGMFARGEFELGHAPAQVLPEAAVVMRDGFAYVFRVGQPDKAGQAKVVQTKVDMGRRLRGQVEILSGLTPGAPVAASGAGFLADGDLVRVVSADQPGQQP